MNGWRRERHCSRRYLVNPSVEHDKFRASSCGEIFSASVLILVDLILFNKKKLARGLIWLKQTPLMGQRPLFVTA
jgi:hypothetical protein